ncbi:uncharacterized protein LOC121280220 isoform X2 [Carcharodon carcharias]|uniref:uncharacterized protein LOC121280220 isoform X2 n=1 Tax=Carcharodon carcharias TaxID=13397 RepID=UPI001B7EAF28|nr:uncharacterized protein LOC121280220 isoform X2 [Carcharodon carcharias]
MNMAHLLFFSKLLIVNGILAVVTDGEITIAIQTSTIGSSSFVSTPDPEITFSANSYSGETLDRVTTKDYEIASSANASDNHTIVTTEIYSTTSANRSPNPAEDVSISAFPDNSSNARTTGPTTSTELQEAPGQRSDTQSSSAAIITSMSYTGNSGSKVSSSQELSTTLHTSVAVQEVRSNLGLAIVTWVLFLILILFLISVLVCYLRRKRRKYSFDLFHKTAEDADIPLSCPVIPGILEANPDREENDYVKTNEDVVNHDKTPVLNTDFSEEIKETQKNCETETNHSPDPVEFSPNPQSCPRVSGKVVDNVGIPT